MALVKSLQELVEEAKKRTFLWGFAILMLAYLLSLANSSLWRNVPVATLIFIVLRYLSFEFEIKKRVQNVPFPSHLSHLLKHHQLSRDEYRLYFPSLLSSTRWKRRIESPIVAAAVEDFTWQIVREFVTDLWYSSLTPDQEVPEQLRIVINDIFGEIAQRAKRINLITFLTQDVVELVGNHLELFRQAKTSVGVKVLGTLSSEGRDDKLKQALLNRKQLHPACLSPESESKVLRQLMNGVVVLLLRPEDVQCKLVKGIARELLACAVLRPVMNLASPSFINQIIEKAVVSKKADKNEGSEGNNIKVSNSNGDGEAQDTNKGIVQASKVVHAGGPSSGLPPKAGVKQGDWAQTLEAVSQRRERTLAPENLDNLWTRGQNYKRKDVQNQAKGSVMPPELPLNEFLTKTHEKPFKIGEPLQKGWPSSDDLSVDGRSLEFQSSERKNEHPNEQSVSLLGERTSSYSQIPSLPDANPRSTMGLPISKHRQPYPFSDEHMAKKPEPEVRNQLENRIRRNSTEDSGWLDDPMVASNLDPFTQPPPKLNCWVVGAHLERSGSNSFAVYSIAVTDADNRTWFVERRFRNFEQLHRRLRDLPQYNLQIPPKRFLSSSLDDAFVRERCISLDKYLKDLLSISSIAELHEVWDFLSITSKNYSYVKSPSVMKTIAVNVDDAVDDMFRQLRGVSDGIFRRSGGPLSTAEDEAGSLSRSALTEAACIQDNTMTESVRSDNVSDDEYGTLPWTSQESKVDWWHSDYEGQTEYQLPDSENIEISEQLKLELQAERKLEKQGSNVLPHDKVMADSDILEDDLVVPSNWTPAKLTVPLLNLVDDIFQLQAKGWIRRQVFWMAKQILQLGMGDAIDDWLVTQVQVLRKEDVVASTIQGVQNILWPGGVFITKAAKDGQNSSSGKVDNRVDQKGTNQSALFEAQLVASRRANVVHEILVDGAPATLVSLIGKNQYNKSAKDIFYFLQSVVFVKQLAFSLLELILTAIFPELNDLVMDVRRGMN